MGGETATASAASARLKQQFEMPPQMFRVCQCLKLARARGRPFGEARLVTPRGLSDTSQEFALGKHPFGFQAGRFACFLQRRQIDMRGQVLFAGIGQQIAGGGMPMIRAQGASRSVRREKFLAGQGNGLGERPGSRLWVIGLSLLHCAKGWLQRAPKRRTLL